jgi:hypothetical protein
MYLNAHSQFPVVQYVKAFSRCGRSGSRSSSFRGILQLLAQGSTIILQPRPAEVEGPEVNAIPWYERPEWKAMASPPQPSSVHRLLKACTMNSQGSLARTVMREINRYSKVTEFGGKSAEIASPIVYLIHRIERSGKKYPPAVDDPNT